MTTNTKHYNNNCLVRPEDSVTIFCSLKGRPAFTKRFLDWCSFIKCPFPIYFADGGDPKEEIHEVVTKYTNLRFTYRHFGYDTEIKDFNRKMAFAMKDIRTPYVFMVDNDDFFCPDGILRHVHFLESNLDYTGSRGSIRDFTDAGKKPGIMGLIFERPSVLGETAYERIINCFENFHSHWHDVARTDELRNIFAVIHKLDINDFKLMVRLHILLTVINGKNNRTQDDPYYFHQVNTVRVPGMYLPLDCQWVRESYFLESLSMLVGVLGETIAWKDDSDLLEVKSKLFDYYTDRLYTNPDKNHAIAKEDYERLVSLKKDVLEKEYNVFGSFDKSKLFDKKKVDFSEGLPAVSVEVFHDQVRQFMAAS